MAIHEFPHNRSVPQLFTDLVHQLTTLVSKEFRLARAEISENVSRAGMGLALIVGGAVLLIPALVVLLDAAVQGLVAAGLAEHWSALVVGGAALLIGLILLMIGINRLKPRALMPNKTIEQVRRDTSVAVQQVRYGNGNTNRAA